VCNVDGIGDLVLFLLDLFDSCISVKLTVLYIYLSGPTIRDRLSRLRS
jgi:hypothetical protein